MAKMFKKADLSYKDGYIIDGEGNIVNVNWRIVSDANALEYRLQRTKWLASQKHDAAPVTEFEFKSAFKAKSIAIDVNTPNLDSKVQEVVKLMDEIDSVGVAEKANQLLSDFMDLVLFVHEDFAVESDCDLERFDLNTLGNPLELTVEDVTDAILELAKHE